MHAHALRRLPLQLLIPTSARRVAPRARPAYARLLALALLAVLPRVCDANIGAPVAIRLRSLPAPLRAGEPAHLELQIQTATAGALEHLRVVAGSWSEVTLREGAVQVQGKRVVRAVDVTATPADPSAPLTLEFLLDGAPMRWALDLSPDALAKATQPLAVVRRQAPSNAAGVATRAQQARPLAPPPEAAHVDDPPESTTSTTSPKGTASGGTAPSVQPQTARLIRVYGRFAYVRDDGVILGADGLAVRVYDDDFAGRQLLQSGITDPSGNFDVSFTWDPCGLCETQPDLKLIFEAANSVVVVDHPVVGNNYLWETGTWTDYTGTSLNVGTVFSADESVNPALHQLTNIMRSWRWLLENQGYDTPQIHLHWPSITAGSSAYYLDLDRAIHVSHAQEWSESTDGHEYGHAWMDSFGATPAYLYCNGVCDGIPPVCSHCIWCGETSESAFQEGWANWLGDIIPSAFAARYGIPAESSGSTEGIPATCRDANGDPCPCPTNETEGFLGALLRDIQDATQDDDAYSPGWADVLSLGTDEIFTVVDLDEPTSPLEFLDRFKARYPAVKEALWETGMEDGYDIDALAPPAPTGLAASGHPVGGTSADATVDFTWTRPDDDASGIAGYSWSLDVLPGHLPDTSVDALDVTGVGTAALAPGTYYFTVRAKDRAGHWGTAFGQYGPFTIVTPEPANLLLWNQIGWSTVVVPRAFNDASAGNVPAPAVLQGNSATTWWSLSARNDGDQATSSGFQARIYIDSAHAGSIVLGSVAGSTNFMALNRGITGTTDPLTVRGGRHTFEGRVDAIEQIAESSETDNVWAHQWCWLPLTLGATAVTRAAPPRRTDGWSAVTDGSALQYNCDGLRLSPGGYFNAAVIRASKSTDDYDCRLHPLAPTTAEFTVNGFPSTNVGYSARGAGCLDAVLTNIWRTGLVPYDVGVLNANDGAGQYTASAVFSAEHALGDSVVVAMAANEMLLLRHFFVPLSGAGPYSIAVDVAPAADPVHVLWLNDSFATGDLLDFTAQAVSDPAGHARLDFIVANEGYNGIVIYRDPKDGTGPISVTLELGATPPDLLAYGAPGWAAPIVPAPAPTGTPASVPLPATLSGNSPSTYFNFAVRNESPSEALSVRTQVDVDGTLFLYRIWSPAHGYSNDLYNGSTGYSIRGGRHLLSLCPDRIGAIEEISESNNVYGVQFVWAPLTLTDSAPLSRPAPPDPLGGVADLRSGDAFYYNCDGLRIPNTGARWHAAATMPGAASDVDLRLHATVLGVQDGFGASLAASGWGVGQSDFVLVDYRTGIPVTVYDVGAVRVGAGTESYTVEASGSQFVAQYPQGTYGPFTLAANRILNLHEFYLDARGYSFELVNSAGSVDWGMTLHPAGVSYQGKSTTVPSGAAWFAGPGVGESVTVTIASAGYYCLAVWKVSNTDLPLSGTYTLRVLDPTVTAVAPLPRAIPERFVVYPNRPNPFNPSTEIRFDLPAPAPVRLAIYDLSGRAVRTLLHGSALAPGEHRAVWDGKDERGVSVASGVYVYRLRAGRDEVARRMVLAK